MDLGRSTTGAARRRSAREAFTTLELMIVVILIGIVAAMAMPSIATTIARDRVRRAQTIVAADVERAFHYAARVRKPVTIKLNSTTKALTAADRSTGTVYFARDLSRTGAWALTGATITPAAGITIFPTGLASSGLRIALSNNDFTKSVNATVAGQVMKP